MMNELDGQKGVVERFVLPGAPPNGKTAVFQAHVRGVSTDTLSASKVENMGESRGFALVPQRPPYRQITDTQD